MTREASLRPALLSAVLLAACGGGATQAARVPDQAAPSEPMRCGWWHLSMAIRFGLGSTAYEADRQGTSETDALDAIAQFMERPGIGDLRVEGHRSGDCGVETDRHAEERAQEIERLLIERGVDPSRLSWRGQTVWIGFPTSPRCAPDSHQRQRVVEFSFEACRTATGVVEVPNAARTPCSADGSASVPCSGARR